MNRRDFLRASAGGGLLATLPAVLADAVRENRIRVGGH